VLYFRSDQEGALSTTAKLFRNGRSQAVRLPASFRFPGSEVYVRRDPATGDVILSRRPDSWQDFFDLVDSLDIPKDFMSKRDHSRPQTRKLF
jgi:antitoxin VapB